MEDETGSKLQVAAWFKAQSANVSIRSLLNQRSLNVL